MRILLTLLAKDVALLRRNRAALVFTFLVPMVIIYIVGLVFGLGRSDSGPTGIPLAVVNQSDNPAARTLVNALEAERAFHVVTTFTNPDRSTRPLTEDDLRPMIHDRKFSYAVVIPADLIGTDRIGLHLKILSDPRNDIEAQTVEGMLQKTIFSHVPQLIGQSLQARARSFLGTDRAQSFDHAIATAVSGHFGGDTAAIEKRISSGNWFSHLGNHADGATDTAAGTSQAGSAETPDLFAKLVRIDREQVVGRDVKSPTATRIVGGYAVMFLLFALSNTAAAFFDDENAGLFQRLLSTPMSRAQLLWSRFLYGVLYGLVQLLALFIAGHFLYGVDVFGLLGSLIVMAAAVAAVCTSFGMLLAAITRTAEAARSLATLLTITMSACGGAWFPISFMPEFMQRIAKFTLVYWSIEGFNSVLWASDTFVQQLPILGILLGTTVVVMTFSVWRFNRSRLFT